VGRSGHGGPDPESLGRAVRVVLHIGVHKSGTSTIQKAWASAFNRSKRIWYPCLPHGPSHALVAWWLREKQGAPAHRSLVDLLADARGRRTETLLLSSEEFHEASAEQVDRLRPLLAGHDVQVLVTLTQPVYRWPSLWQEMVKHGWAAEQGKSIAQVDEPGVLGPGRLEDLVDRWSLGDMTICLVRQHPPEPELASRTSALVGVDLPGRAARRQGVENVSLGDVETRILGEVNRLAPDTRGIESPRGRGVVEALRAFGPAGSPRVLIDPEVVDHVAEVAALEKAALERLWESGRVKLDDRCGLLQKWDRMD
jgi:hypothetical protein